jgi:RNA polymerase sigma factor (sigma-70 family)
MYTPARTGGSRSYAGVGDVGRTCGSPSCAGVGDVGALYCSLAPRLERIVGSGVQAPRALIEDACQVAWIRLWHHRDRVRRENVLAWLVTTAIREAHYLLRRETRCLSLERAVEESGDGALYGRALPDLCEAWVRLELISSLSERQQQLVWLHGLGFSYEEIATATGATRRTVERQLLRGRRKLRALAAEGS